MKIKTGFISNSSSEAFICNAEYYSGENPTRYTPEQAEEILRKILSSHIEIMTMHCPDYALKDFVPYDYDKVFQKPHYITPEDVEEMENWSVKIDKKSIGKDLIIYSIDDNSVPWGIFDIIETKFYARRVHLG